MSLVSNLSIGSKVLLPSLIIGLVTAIIWLVFSTNADLAIGLVIGLVPTFITLYQRKKEREEDYKNWLMQNKEAYAIEMIDTLISQLSDSDNQSGEKLLRRINRLLPSLLVWGSPNVMRLWEDLQNSPSDRDTSEIIRRGERFLRTIRKSLRHDDSSLPPGAIWSLLIKADDKDQVYKACEGETYDDL